MFSISLQKYKTRSIETPLIVLCIDSLNNDVIMYEGLLSAYVTVLNDLVWIIVDDIYVHHF